MNHISFSQANTTNYIDNLGLTYEPAKLLGFSSWGDFIENNVGNHHVPFQPLFHETQPNSMGINSNLSQGNDLTGKHCTAGVGKHHENGSLIQAEGNWQVLDELYDTSQFLPSNSFF